MSSNQVMWIYKREVLPTSLTLGSRQEKANTVKYLKNKPDQRFYKQLFLT